MCVHNVWKEKMLNLVQWKMKLSVYYLSIFSVLCRQFKQFYPSLCKQRVSKVFIIFIILWIRVSISYYQPLKYNLVHPMKPQLFSSGHLLQLLLLSWHWSISNFLIEKCILEGETFNILIKKCLEISTPFPSSQGNFLVWAHCGSHVLGLHHQWLCPIWSSRHDFRYN